MKKRVLILALALVMALSVAAPAFAINLGDTFTKAEIEEMFETGSLKKYYAGLGGASIPGAELLFDGTSDETEKTYIAGTVLYADEEGNLFRLQAVMDEMGTIVYQCMFLAPFDPKLNLTEDKPDMTMYGNAAGDTVPVEEEK